LQLAQIAVDRKQGAEAVTYLDRLPAAEQARTAVQLLRARALYWAGQRDAAANLLRQAEAKDSGDAAESFSAGMAYAEWKQYDKAEAAFTRALNADPANRDVLYNLGLAAIGAGHMERAREALQSVLLQKPDDVEALYAVARSYAEVGNNAMALLPLIEARRIAPHRPDVLEFIGHVSDALGYYGDAVIAYEEYLKIHPENDVVRRERAFNLVRSNRLQEGIGDLESYAKKHPRDPAGFFELALAVSVREPEQALGQLNQALALKPDYTAALYSRGSIRLQLNEPAEAVKDLQRVLDREPDNVRALDRIGQCYIYLERWDDATKVLGRAAQLAPRDGKVLTHYSQALRGSKRFDEAKAALESFRQIPPEMRRLPFGGMLDFLSLPAEQQRERYFEGLQRSSVINPGNAEVQFRLGNELLARGKTSEALAAHRKALALDSKYAAQIGKNYLVVEQWAYAREFLQAAAGADPSADTRLDLAIAAFHETSPEAGMAEIEKIPPAERKGDYYLVRAQMLDALGKFEEAVAALNDGFRAAPTRAELYPQAANFLLKRRHNREAVELLDQATRLLPDSPELRLAHAVALELSRRTEQALKELAAIQTRWPEWNRSYLIQGIILDINHKPAEARQALETAIALGSETAETYYFLALTITETAPEDTAGAEKAIARALALNQNDPYIRGLAGKLAYTRGQAKLALGHLQEATRLFPNYTQAHYNLAMVYRSLGEEDKALAELKEVRRIRAEDPRPETETPPLTDLLVPPRR
ncbi:MAG TPA: tetratricopeptide repeat protein, partial [Bryobacteraceae bacterium]